MSLPQGRFVPNTWYGYDVSNNVIVDSIKWQFNRPKNPDERPRGIAFSITGDTAYVSCFIPYDDFAMVQRYKKHGDQIAPQITHSAITIANSGQSLIISTAITDNVNISKAKLYFHQGGEVNFDSTTMYNISGDTYQATIAASIINEKGLEYYISATDPSNNIKTFPEIDPKNYPQIVQVHSTNLTRPEATPDTAYRMISVPIDLDKPSPKHVLEDNWGSYDDTQWRLLRYVNGQNLEYTVHNPFDNFDPGKGFWLITRHPRIIAVGAGYSVTTAQNRTIILQPGWNQIGNPFAFPIKWSNVIKSADVEDKLVGYYGLCNEATGYDHTCTQLKPWEGYFVNNLGNSSATIEIPPLAATPGELDKTVGNVLALYEFEGDEWGLQITAQCHHYLDKDNYLGCLQDAADAWDHNDFSEAPFFDKHVSLYFPHENWKIYPGLYTGDFRSLSKQGNYWDFYVKSNIPNSKVALTLADLKNLPSDWNIFLLDMNSNVSIDFKDDGKYIFPSNNRETMREFRIVVGEKQFIETNDMDLSGLPSEYKLEQNYPNPFNSETQINYIVASLEQVEIIVYNLMGQRIRTLVNEQHSAGRYTISWNGSDHTGGMVTSGVYLLRMEAGEFVGVRKMVLAR